MIRFALSAFLCFSPLQAAGKPSPAQQVFVKRKITLAGRSISVEIADDEGRRERGLMFREKLAENEGMLFIFERAKPLGFWMKNTLIPLSIGYFDPGGALIEVLDMEPASPMELSPKVYPSSRPALYALEMNKGWFKKNEIGPGAKLKLSELPKAKP